MDSPDQIPQNTTPLRHPICLSEAPQNILQKTFPSKKGPKRNHHRQVWLERRHVGGAVARGRDQGGERD